MNNLERLQMETKGIELEQPEMMVYLEENGLSAFDEYNASSPDNKKSIYQTALGVLESIANNPSLMKSIRLDDMTVSQFHENLMERIDQLSKKIRQMKTDHSNTTDVFILFK